MPCGTDKHKKPAFAGQWDESKHKRDKGRFAPKEGSREVDDLPGVEPDDYTANAIDELEEKIGDDDAQRYMESIMTGMDSESLAEDIANEQGVDPSVALGLIRLWMKNMNEYSAKPVAMFSRIPGGRYQAKQQPDGTWDVLRVPIFSVVPKGVKGAPKDITQADLETAVGIHQRAFHEDKTLARCNVLHNYQIHKATGAGFFLPQEVRMFRMRGRLHPVVFADLLALKDDVFKLLDSDELPYCSVEVRSWDPLEFGALALLDTEPPFFNGFPNINIGEREEAQTLTTELTRFSTTKQAPAVAAFVCSTGARFLFRFEEDSMADEDKKPFEKKDDDKNSEANMGDGDLKSAISAIEASMKEFQPLLDLLPKLQEMLAGGGEEVPGTEESPADLETAPALSAKSMATMEGRVAALEDFRADVKRKEDADGRFSAALETLEDEGYELSDASKTRLRKFAEKSQEDVDLFMAGFREIAPQDPPPELGGLPEGETAWPDEVMAFSDKDPEIFSAAQKAYLAWRDLPDDQYRSPLERFLRREVS